MLKRHAHSRLAPLTLRLSKNFYFNLEVAQLHDAEGGGANI